MSIWRILITEPSHKVISGKWNWGLCFSYSFNSEVTGQKTGRATFASLSHSPFCLAVLKDIAAVCRPVSRMTDLSPKWIRMVQKETNPGLFRSDFSRICPTLSPHMPPLCVCVLDVCRSWGSLKHNTIDRWLHNKCKVWFIKHVDLSILWWRCKEMWRISHGNYYFPLWLRCSILTLL